MIYAQRIEEKLTATLSPEILIVRDDSHKHEGHAGARPEGETHFYVEIFAPQLLEHSRVERQREIYKILEDEIKERVHALEIKILTSKD